MKPKNSSESATLAVPAPKTELTIPPEKVGKLMTIWPFLFSFARGLKLSPFTLDDFEQALVHDNSAVACSLLNEIHASLLHNISDYTGHTVYKQLKQGYKPKNVETVQPTNGSAPVSDSPKPPQPEDDQTDGDAQSVSIEDDDENNALALSELDLIMDYQRVGSWWRMKITPQRWEIAFLAYLLHLATVQKIPNLTEIVRKLLDVDVEVEQWSGRILVPHFKLQDVEPRVKTNYYKLNGNERIDILFAMINDDALLYSPKIKKFVDDSNNLLAEVKREKRDLEAQKRELLLEQKTMEKKENEEGSEDIMDVVDEALAADEDVEIGFEEQNKEIAELQQRLEALEHEGRGNRQEKIKLQQQIKELEQIKRKAKVEKAKELAREASARRKEDAENKKRVDSNLEKILVRETELDREIKIYSGGMRLKPLGKDRFWNRYWWVDGYGSGVAGIADPDHVNKNLLQYGTGRLWVEGAGHVEHLGNFTLTPEEHYQIFRRKRVPRADGGDPLVTLPKGFKGITPGTASGKNWLEAGQMGILRRSSADRRITSLAKFKGCSRKHTENIATEAL